MLKLFLRCCNCFVHITFIVLNIFQAFKSLSEAALNKLEKDPEKLKSVLKSHMVAGKNVENRTLY